VYHDLSRGTTAGRSARSRLQRTILTTSIMHQVAKGYIRGACAEIREDGETSPRADSFGGVVGERHDNRGGHEQGIAVGARDRVLTPRYERPRTLRCECSSKRACGLAEW